MHDETLKFIIILLTKKTQRNLISVSRLQLLPLRPTHPPQAVWFFIGDRFSEYTKCQLWVSKQQHITKWTGMKIPVKVTANELYTTQYYSFKMSRCYKTDVAAQK